MFESLFGDDDSSPEAIVPDTIGGKTILQRPPEERAASKFIGLENQGATCYLNSLLQSMYMTPELRFGLFDIDPVDLGVEYMEEFEKGKKMNEDAGIIEADDGLLSQMKEIGFSEFGSRKALIATKNAGLGEAMDWYSNNPNEQEPSPSELAEEKKKKKRKPRLIPLELQSLFTKMMHLNRLAISTEDLTRKGFQWQGMDGRVQHDAHELNRLLIDALEKSLKHTKGETLCRIIYQGMLSYQTTCLTCYRISTRSEPYYDLNVQIIGCEDLTKSLRTYCASEVLEGDSAYHCDNCGHKVTAHRRTVINSLPPVLTISLNRFRIDKSTNWQRQKVTASSSFPLLLDFSPYIGENASVSAPLPLSPDVVSVQSVEELSLLSSLKSHAIWIDEVSTIALELASTIIGRYIEVNPQLQSAPELSELSLDDRLCIDDRIIGSYERITLNGSMELGKIDVQGGYNSNTPDSKTYQLSTVIMHRGSAHSGHYFAYIRDQLDEGSWSLPMSSYDDITNEPKGTNKSSHVQYIKTKDANGDVLYQVYDSSPLAVVLSILEEYGAPYNLVNSQSSDLSMSCNTIAISRDKILKEVTRIKGQAWTRCFRPVYGNFTDFLKSVEEVLGSDDETGNTIFLLPSAYKKYVCIQSTESNEATAETQHIALTNSSVSDEIANNIVGDSDEQIARTLQEEEYVKAPSRSTRGRINNATTDDDSSSWETVKRGKKNKNSKSPTPADFPVQVLVPSEKTKDEKTSQAKHRNYLEKSLADNILGFYFGKFYEFNDSRVNAMPIKNLMKSFQGKDSAYLLVYRQVTSSLPRLGRLSSVSMRKHPSEQMRERSSVPPPSFWYEKVQAMNLDLSNQRSTYEKNSQNIKIVIKFPGHVQYNYPAVYLRKLEGKESSSRSLRDLKDGLEMSVSEKMKLSELSTLLINNYAAYLPSLGIDTTSTDSMIFSILRLLPSSTEHASSFNQEAFQLLYKLSPSTTIYDLQRDSDKAGKYLLFWKGILPSIDEKMIPVTPFSSPLFSIPIAMLSTVSLSLTISEDEVCDTVLTKDGVFPACRKTVEKQFYYPGDSTLEDACLRICELFHILIDNAIIHVKTSLSKSSLESAERANKVQPEVIDLSMEIVESASDDKESKRLRKGADNLSITPGYPLQIINRGVLVYRGSDKQANSQLPAVSSSGRPIRSVRNTPSNAPSTPTIVRLQDISNLIEIVVEDASCAPPLLHSLAVIEQFQHQSIQVVIHYMIRGSSSENFLIKESWMVFADKTLIVELLKSYAIEHFHLNGAHEKKNLYFFEYQTVDTLYQIKSIQVNESIAVEDSSWFETRIIALATFNDQEINLYAASSSISKASTAIPEIVTLKIHYEAEAIYPMQISTEATIVETKQQIYQFFFPNAFDTFPPISFDNQFMDIQPYYYLRNASIEYGSGSGKYHSSFRLHHATWNGDIGHIIEEYDDSDEKENTWKRFFEDHMNVFSASANREYDIYMVPGHVPVKGRKNIPVYLWMSQPLDHQQYMTSLKQASSASNTNEAMDIVEDQSTPPSSTTEELELSKEEAQYISRVLNMKQQYLYPLGILTCHDVNILADLYSYVFNHLTAQIPVLQMFQYDVSTIASAESSDHILIRDMTPTALPGKCYWLAEPKVSSVGSMSKIGMKSETKSDIKTLKKVGLFNVKEKSSGLIVEILPQTQSKLCPPSTAVHLWYHRLDDEYDEQYMKFRPTWPPESFVFSHGAAPNLAHLKRKLSDLSSIPFESIRVAKHDAVTAQWKEFLPGMKATGSKAAGSTNGVHTSNKKIIITSKKKGEDNLFELPYAVRDGDVFCVYDQTKHTAFETDESMDEDAIKIRFARREDVLQQKMIAIAAARKKKGFTVRRKSDRKSVALIHRPEVNLSLGRNLDFSDDEVDMME